MLSHSPAPDSTTGGVTRRTRLSDFVEAKFRLRRGCYDLPDQAEAAAVQRSRPELAQRAAVVGCRITAIVLPAIAGMTRGIIHHHAVAGDLGDDRCGRNRPALGVAVDDRFGGALPLRAGIAIDQH